MNISRKWLREFVDITATDKEYDSVMTLAGQKVETTERMDAEIKNVVVGKVLSMKKHENSDHMWVCMVDCGAGEPVQIVTGAQNVHEGDLVPVAQHNSYLPGGIHITKGKLRGVESCGMLCSYKELGLTEHDCPEAYADGIWILNDEGCTVGEDMNIVIGNALFAVLDRADRTVADACHAVRAGFAPNRLAVFQRDVVHRTALRTLPATDAGA